MRRIWALYADDDDPYGRYVVAVFSSKDEAEQMRDRAEKDAPVKHSAGFWGVDRIGMDPTWEELLADGHGDLA